MKARMGEWVWGGLRREEKDTVIKRGELRDRGPLDMKSERDKVVESLYKEVIMIQHEISVG